MSSAFRFSEVFYRCVTPLHIGCGQDVGIVDLPVIRERTTGYPFIPGSSARGALRAACEEREVDSSAESQITPRLFGSEDAQKAGCVVVTDSHVLLFPVRSTPGVFQWITCPFALDRLASERRYFLGPADVEPDTSPTPDDDEYLGGLGRGRETIFLEEYPFSKSSQRWRWAEDLPGVASGRVVLVSDSVFLHFVSNATLIAQRNRLTSVKTVAKGQLFSLEAVPPETVFHGFLGATHERSPDDERWDDETVQGEFRKLLLTKEELAGTHLSLGGKEAVGYGLTSLTWRRAAEQAGEQDH